MDNDAFQLRELVPPDSLVLEPGWPWWAWVLLSCVAILLIYGIIRLTSQKGRPPQIPRIDYRGAYQRAIEEIESSANLPLHESATRISGAIRLYLATVCHDSSLFETHEEFLGRHQALQDFPESVREQVSTTLCQLAALKYDQPRSQAAPSLGQQSRAVIDQLHQSIPA